MSHPPSRSGEGSRYEKDRQVFAHQRELETSGSYLANAWRQAPIPDRYPRLVSALSELLILKGTDSDLEWRGETSSPTDRICRPGFRLAAVDLDHSPLFCPPPWYNGTMPYKTGTWGEQAKARSKKRNDYFRLYKRDRRDPIKIKARYLVERAVKNGDLVRTPCEVCGAVGRIEAHHTDYSKPLQVQWLCPKHHRERHTS